MQERQHSLRIPHKRYRLSTFAMATQQHQECLQATGVSFYSAKSHSPSHHPFFATSTICEAFSSHRSVLTIQGRRHASGCLGVLKHPQIFSICICMKDGAHSTQHTIVAYRNGSGRTALDATLLVRKLISSQPLRCSSLVCTYMRAIPLKLLFHCQNLAG